MPLIDRPFKRVAVDIVGPIAPPSEAGHRYILTLVDYATRHTEAVSLKKITTEAVAEAFLDIYSRVGIPEEVLTDQETQFMSECMQEVSRLLSIKGLTITPYHTICNVLDKRWNGTLKSMLKRLFFKTSQSSGTDCSTLFCLHIEKFLKSQQHLVHSSCCMDVQLEDLEQS